MGLLLSRLRRALTDDEQAATAVQLSANFWTSDGFLIFGGEHLSLCPSIPSQVLPHRELHEHDYFGAAGRQSKYFRISATAGKEALVLDAVRVVRLRGLVTHVHVPRTLLVV